MSNIFDFSQVPNIFLKIRKLAVFSFRKPFSDWIDTQFVLDRFKSYGLDIEFFSSLEQFEDAMNNGAIDDNYLENLFFITDAPKTKQEISIIDAVKPKNIIWFSYPDYNFVIKRYESSKLIIDGEVEIPFTPFSTALERKFLYDLAKNVDVEGGILEIGAYSGGTSVALGLGNKKSKVRSKIISVDRGFQEDYTTFTGQVGVLDDIVMRKCHSSDFINVYEDVAQNNLGSESLRILWVDGDHTYAGCKNDIRNFKKYICDGGVIAVHDYGLGDHGHAGINRAVMEEIVSDPDFSNYAVVGSIFYAEKNRDCPLVYFSRPTKPVNDPKNVFYWLTGLEKIRDSKVIFYGAGFHTLEILNLAKFDKKFLDSIIAIVDDNIHERKLFEGFDLFNPSVLESIDYDYVVISAYDFEEAILAKLKERNVPDSKVIKVYLSESYRDFALASWPSIRSYEDVDSLLFSSGV